MSGLISHKENPEALEAFLLAFGNDIIQCPAEVTDAVIDLLTPGAFKALCEHVEADVDYWGSASDFADNKYLWFYKEWTRACAVAEFAASVNSDLEIDNLHKAVEAETSYRADADKFFDELLADFRNYLGDDEHGEYFSLVNAVYEDFKAKGKLSPASDG